MVEINYEEAARRFLNRVKGKALQSIPLPIIILLTWGNEIYFGSVQEICPKFSKEIVYLSKTSKPVPREFYEAIRKIEPSILAVKANEHLDLEGRGHFLRRLEDELTYMTPEQTEYIIRNPPKVFEL